MEKSAEVTERTQSPEIEHTQQQGKPWMYKRLNLGLFSIPGYATPQFQIIFVACVCFLCPGMFNAVNGMGAGGQVNAKDVNDANTAVYATFSIVGFFCGSLANKIGLRLTLGIGGFGYMLYVASLLNYNHNQNRGFLIFAGALLGTSAGMLWTAQGAIMMAYPTEKEKGKYIARFWAVFNLGGVVGACIPFGLNFHREAGKVQDGTYIGFIILMGAGFVLACFLCDPKYVRRDDGTSIIMMKNPTWKSEFIGMLEVLKTDWYIVALFPMFWASNWFYTYHFQVVNLAYFNLRSRLLNNILYWSMQIVGAFVVGFLLDYGKMRRSLRARYLIGGLLVLTMIIWGPGYKFQEGFTRANTLDVKTYVGADFKESRYVGPMFLYMFYGFYDAAWQVSAYWLMGSFSNNGRKLANFAGFYKGIQSAGNAIGAQVDSLQTPFMTEFAINWGMLAGSLVLAFPVVLYYVHDTIPIEEDLKFSDETIADVVPVSNLRSEKGEYAESK